MLVTRGSGYLSVLPAGQAADPAALAGAYVRQVLQPNAQGLSLSQGLQTIRLGDGQVGLGFAVARDDDDPDLLSQRQRIAQTREALGAAIAGSPAGT